MKRQGGPQDMDKCACESRLEDGDRNQVDMACVKRLAKILGTDSRGHTQQDPTI